jgi:hypothetical protein
MAIIFTYPTKATPALTDTVVITDSESEDPEDRTKQISIASIKTTMGVVDGTGTTGTIPVFTGATTLGDSTITTSGNNISIPGYIARTGFPDTYFGYEATGNSKNIALVSNGTQTVRSISDGTNSYGWLGHNGNTRLYATSTGAQLQGDYFDIPKYIRHVSDTDSFFGFSGANSFILDTESGRKIAAGPDHVTLYSDTSETATTTSVARFATATTGAIVYGQTIAAGAASERGGIIRYYNNANDRYVGISGPVTQGTSYQVRLPDSVGEAGQVLKLNTPIIGGSTQDLVWGDAAGITYTAGINISISGTNVISATNTTYTTATSGTLGLVKIGYPESGKNYPVELLNDQMFVNVPWTDTGTTYSASTGLTLTGTVFSANTVGAQSNLANNASSVSGRSYPIQTGAASGTVGSDHLIVNVPWTDNNTTYTAGSNVSISGTNVISAEFSLDVATSAVLGGIKSHLNYGAQVTVNAITSTSSRFYGVVINDDYKAMVNVPWTDTVTPVVTASQGLTKTSNNITLDIADPATGWAILGGGPGASTPIIGGFAGANATGNKNYGISNFMSNSNVTSAQANVAIGFDSMGTSVTTASNNVVVGFAAGSSMTTATDSVLIGKDAGASITTAPNVVLVGQDAGTGVTTGGENTIIGSNAGETITTGSRNTIIGSAAVASSGANSVFATIIGREAEATSSSVAVGSGAAVAGATGVAVGNGARTASNAPNGIALGLGANATLQGTVGNVAIGSQVSPVSLTQPEEFSASFEYLNVTINGDQYYIRLYKSGE